ncbi:MAG TPA: ABC transporter permease [Planctomycetota bacterium]|nr:ABC transporter permease [Planctomycetota bacterium]
MKESLQVLRDPSSLLVGVVLPGLVIFVLGYGLSLDARNVPVIVVLEEPTPDATELASCFQLSSYFETRVTTSMREAESLMLRHEIDAIVRVPPHFSRALAAGDSEVQVLLHGTDGNRARIIQSYARGALAQLQVRHGGRVALDPVIAQDRLWFNEANDSRHFLVPGLVVLIMTLIGALLTALVVAREWERGTFEALFVTPVRPAEILLGKMVPYFLLGMLGLGLCLLSARLLFHVPLRGSIVALVGASALYLVVALGFGLLISSLTKNQFAASFAALNGNFAPTFMLSGFLFDVRSMPAILRLVSRAFPASYYVRTLQTLFLAGNVWDVVLPDMAVLAVMAVALLGANAAVLRKSLA